MAYFLHLVEGDSARLIKIAGHRLRIGRGSQAELRLGGAGVALEHAEIVRRKDGLCLRDLGSVTGTYREGRRIEEATLGDGDEVAIGSYRLKIQHPHADDPVVIHVSRAEQVATGSIELSTVLIPIIPEGALVRPDSPPGSVPSAPTWRQDSAVSGVMAVSSLTTAASSARPNSVQSPEIDYVRAYRLGRGLLMKAPLSAALVLLAVAMVAMLAGGGGDRTFLSPGKLAAVHEPVIGSDCADCHHGWRRVSGSACNACHRTVGDHHQGRARVFLDCTDCHREHQGDDRLLPTESTLCTRCHAAQVLRAGLEPRFATGIRAFDDGSHPQVALEIDGRRVRLDAVRQTTAGADVGGVAFSHRDHLSDFIRRESVHRIGREVSCVFCHRENDGGEILPIAFEHTCRPCHLMALPKRVALSPEEGQAPHGEPKQVLRAIFGLFQAHPEILRTPLDAGERNLLRRRGWSREDKLRALALREVARLMVKTCAQCHALTPPTPNTQAAIEATVVAPVRLDRRFFPHAQFRHGPHTPLRACAHCHPDAEQSTARAEVLLPGIEVCLECHRSTPSDLANGARSSAACTKCHRYHPEMATPASEGSGAVQASDVSRPGPMPRSLASLPTGWAPRPLDRDPRAPVACARTLARGLPSELCASPSAGAKKARKHRSTGRS